MKYILLPLLLILAAGCAQTPYIKGKLASDKGEYETAISLLYKAIDDEPDNHKVWQEIGLVYYRKGFLDKAEEAYKIANSIQPDAMSNLYLGLIYEQQTKYDKALDAYAAATNFRADGRTGKMIKARFDALLDKKLIFEASQAINNETAIAIDSIPSNSIGVISFDGTSLPRELEPLAIGLAEFTALDLGKIKSLTVVERLKIEVILKELKMSRSIYNESAVAPRIGKLIGSRQLVMGTITSVGGNSFRIDGALVDITDSSFNRTEGFEGRLNQFFKIQKEFVFDLIDSMGIELTREERDAIEEVPTESFLAFMAYSQGLFYRSHEMHESAMQSFNNAQNHDPDFGQASDMAGKMAQTVAYAIDKPKDDAVTPTEDFEQEIKFAMKMEDQEVALDYIQTINLMNSGFIKDPQTYFRFGPQPVAPPGGGPIRDGSATIIIEGDLDAD